MRASRAAVLHAVNIRLAPRDLPYTVNHAGDSVLFVDASQWTTIERGPAG